MAGDVDEVLSVEARLLDNVTAQMKGIGKATLKQFKAMGKAARSFKKSMGNVANSLVSIKGLILGAGLAKTFQATVGAAAKFESQMASVATLSKDMSDNIGQFSKEVLDLSAQSGQGLDTLTTSLFDAVSAGVAAGDAMEFLGVATKLAIGGATETSVAVDGLTTIINAFGLETSQAGDVSDAFFTAMKFGKTTVQELSESVGVLAPTAKAAGLEFDQMLGAVSALTKAGFGTKDAVTALQGALVAINSLTPEATKKISDMGLSTKITGEEGATFIDVLNNITEAGGGTLEGVKKLIPNIQGVKGILALSAKEGANFKEVMKLMGDRAGETAKAYSKFTDTFEFKSNKVKQSFNAAFIEVGNQIMPAMNDLMDGILKHMDSIRLGIAFAVAAVQDVWGSLVFVIKSAANSIIGTIAGVIGGIAKLVSKIPKRFLPDGWQEGIEKFANTNLDVAGQSFQDIVTDVKELEGSSVLELFGSASEVISETATSVKDLTDAEKELVGITQEAAAKEAALSQQKLDERKALLEQVKQLELDFQARTHEGRLALLETEKSDLLVQAANLEGAKLAITQEFDAKIIEEKKAHEDKVAAMDKKATADKLKASKEVVAGIVREKQARIALAVTWGNTASTVIKSIAQISSVMGMNAKAVKKIMLGEAIMSGALSIAKANASAPFPLNIPAIIAATATATAQTATIASQAFESGGFPVGRNANIKVNEKGQEAVLNAGATARAGSDTINRMNAGRSTSTVTNEISYSPTFTIGQEASQDIFDVLKKDKAAFGSFLQEELIDRGYFNPVQG